MKYRGALNFIIMAILIGLDIMLALVAAFSIVEQDYFNLIKSIIFILICTGLALVFANEARGAANE